MGTTVSKKLGNLKFRRQQPIGAHIVDFVTFQHKLVIELDGGHHNQDSVVTRDAQRTADLEAAGYRVLRFWNHDVLANLASVLDVIEGAITARMKSPSPYPLPSRERE